MLGQFESLNARNGKTFPPASLQSLQRGEPPQRAALCLLLYFSFFKNIPYVKPDYCTVYPPSITSDVAVIYEALSDARNRIA
ncbi:hypothetical protein Nos7107_1109 [Nostoc sp. PCC 7107]|nr:hypothetical protein Nos7107_1109 [Nostoc sp. PCC 7107]